MSQESIFDWIVTETLPVSERFEGSLKSSGRADKVLPNKAKSHSNGMDRFVICLGNVKVGETVAIREGIGTCH